MKFLKALWGKIRIWDRQAAKSVACPVENADLAIEDSKAQVAKFKESIRSAMASNKLLERRKQDAEGDATKYRNIAKAAVKAGNDTDAKDALNEALRFERQVAAYTKDIDVNKTIISRNQDLLDRAENKIVNAETNKEILATRLQSAQVREDLAKANSVVGNDSGPLAALDNLEKAVDKAECYAEATEQIEGVGETTLEEKYSSDNTDVDSELAKLKATV
jgi:phage shock protein A